MIYNKLDSEYCVMNVDCANNHPMLNWGSTDYSAFLEALPIDEKTLDLPLKIVFDEPYPKPYEMADFLMLGSEYASSEKLKTFFETQSIFGVQFVPAQITTDKKEIINGHYAIHFWNQLPVIDKNNYEGEEPNMFGNILNLQRFSLNEWFLLNIPFEQRKIFTLEENSSMIIIHQSICEALQKENLTGMRFWKVSEWDDNAMFR